MNLHQHPESALLKESIRWYISCENESTPQVFQPAAINWERLGKLASLHQVTSVLYLFLSKNCPLQIPESCFSKLKAQYLTAAFLTQAKACHLAKLMALFQANDLQVVPWRGLALAQAYYANPSDRNFGDHDFLIRKEYLPRIKDRLVREGYRLGDVGEPEETIVREHHAMAFCKEEGGIHQELDFHWAFAESKWRIPFPDAELWQRLQTPAFPGSAFPAMHPEDLLLALTIHHGLRNHWTRLKYLLDLALVLKKTPHVDWTRLLSKAERLGIERHLLCGVLAMKEWTGAPLPQALQNHASRSLRVRYLSDAITHHFAGKTMHSLPWLLLQPRFLPAWFGTLRERAVRLFRPNENDFNKVSFPSVFRFLYYPYRWLRLLKKYGVKFGWNYLFK